MGGGLSCARGAAAFKRCPVGDLRRIAELVPEVLSELVVAEEAGWILAVPTCYVRTWIHRWTQ